MGVTAVTLTIGYHHTLDLLIRQSQTLMHSHATNISDWVEERKHAVESVTAVAKLETAAPYLRQAKATVQADAVYIGYPDKKMADSETEVTAVEEGFDPTSRPWYQQAAAARGTMLTEPYIDAGTKKMVITFATPIREGNQLIGVAGLDVLMDSVFETIAAIRPTPHTWGFIVNKAGKIVVHDDQSLLLKDVAEIAPTLGINVLREYASGSSLNVVRLAN